jgi:hypothetical protein
VQDCYAAGRNQFRFEKDRKCYVTCPAGWWGDPVAGNCVEKCPDNSYAQNNVCNTNCAASSYAYDVSNLCLSDCPAGYFKHDTTWKCVQVCPGTFYGLDSNSSCVAATTCNPQFADPTTKRCVSVCNRTTAAGLTQYADSNGWACKTTCADGSFGNPLTGTCLAAATSCPDGYFGDTTL